MAIFNGSNGNDTYPGTSEADSISGNGGDDTLFGLGENDTISGGDGSDSINGGSGADIITGGTGADSIRGGSGNDTIDAGAENDTVDGGSNNDLINAGDGNNYVYGNSGNDTITSGSGNDFVYGEKNPTDTLPGGEFDYQAYYYAYSGYTPSSPIPGGTGNFTDTGTYPDQHYGNITITGAPITVTLRDDDNFLRTDGLGANNDVFNEPNQIVIINGVEYPVLLEQIVTYQDPSGNTYRFLQLDYDYNHSGIAELGNTGAGHFEQGGLQILLSSPPPPVGAALTVVPGSINTTSDHEYETNFDDLISTGAGVDYVFGQQGNDTIDAGAGADIVDGGVGNESIRAGDGLDNDVIQGGTGYDTIWGGAGHDLLSGDYTNDTLPGADLIHGEAGNDTINGGLGDDTLDGGADNDMIMGGLGNDSVDCGTGADRIIGDAGSDTIHGGDDGDSIQSGVDADLVYADAGNDSINSDIGNDTVYGGAGADNIDGFGGHDLIYGDDSVAGVSDGNDTISGGIGDDTIHGGGGNDLVDGDIAGDTLYGGADSIDGGSGDDTIRGGVGNDWLFGGDNDDSLLGGAGSDRLNGGLGVDVLDGGLGNDQITAGLADTAGGGDDRDTFTLDLADGGSGGFAVNGGTGSTAAGDADDYDSITLGPGLSFVLGSMEKHEDESGPGLSYSGSFQVTDGTRNYTVNFTEIENLPICFARGSRIETIHGPMPVEKLRAGDMLRTRDNGYKPISWIGSRVFLNDLSERMQKIGPIRISAGALGKNAPARDLYLSPQHRVLVRSRIAERMFGEKEVLVAAKHLLALPGVEAVADYEEVEYFHILFDQHEIVYADGLEAESLFTGPQALKSLTAEAKEEIFTIFPELAGMTPEARLPMIRPALSGRLARKLTARHQKNGIPMQMAE